MLDAIVRLLTDDIVQVPQRPVQPLAGGGSLFVMPAMDQKVVITKPISFTPANAQKIRGGQRRPTIQGDVVKCDIASAERRLILDGPTVTARRTAAVSLLAAQRLACCPQGPLLIVGAGRDRGSAGLTDQPHGRQRHAGVPQAPIRVAAESHRM